MRWYSSLLFLFSGILFTLSAFAWGYRRERSAYAFFLFLLAEGWACLCFGVNLTSLSFDEKLFWNHAEHLGLQFIAPLMLVLAFRLTGYEKKFHPALIAAVLAIPILGLLLNWTSEWHRFYYARVWMESYAWGTVLRKTFGPFYFVNFLFAIAIVITACGVLIYRTDKHPVLRTEHVRILLMVFLTPLVMFLMYLFGICPEGLINVTHIGFFLTAIGLTILVFGGNFRNILIALETSEERNRLLVTHARAMLFTLSPDGVFAYISPHGWNLLGYPPEKMEGRSYKEFVLPEDIPICAAALGRAMATDVMQSGIEYRIRHSDGTIHWNVVSLQSAIDEQTGASVCVGVSHDISTVKQAQEKLLATNAHLAHLITNQEVRLRAVIQSALSASDNEAQRIGKEIHDGLCQELVALFRMAEKIEDLYTKKIGSPPSSVSLSQQASHALRLARGISHELTLWDLVDQKLPDALATFVHRIENVMEISIELNCPDNFFAFDSAEAQHVYRVVREAVINAIRHGKPRHIWIDIVEEPEQVIVSVANDTTSTSEVAPAQRAEGFGIRQMKMRARLLSGTFHLRQTADGKTVAELVVPRDKGFPFSPPL